MSKEDTPAPAPAEEQKPVDGEAAETQAEHPKVEEQPKEEPVQEEEKPDVERVWRAKMNCQMPWRDFVRGETVKLKDSQVDSRVRALFDCLTPGEAEEKKVDPDVAVMVSRLKAAKVPMKKNMSEDKIRELFDRFLGSGATAGEISKDAK